MKTTTLKLMSATLAAAVLSAPAIAGGPMGQSRVQGQSQFQTMNQSRIEFARQGSGDRFMRERNEHSYQKRYTHEKTEKHQNQNQTQSRGSDRD